MKVLFILPDVNSYHKLNIHFGIAYMSAVLKSNGYGDIRFITVTTLNDYNHVVSEVISFKPNIVGFSSVETQFANVINLSERIKEVWECRVVCGGVFPTLYPECVKDAKYLDGIFCGETETAFLKFVSAIERCEDFHSIENFCFYDEKEGRIIKNRMLPLDKNLDRLGPPDRDIFDFQHVIDGYGGAAPFMFNRGCPYNCTYCANHALASVYGGIKNSIRRRSIDSCIAEVKSVVKRYKFDVIHIWDDLFVTNRKWLYDFLDRYKSEVRIPFMCTTRSNLSDDDLFKYLQEGGCYKVHMSLESGNDFIRNLIMNRKISREKVIRSFELAKKYGVKVSASSIIGIPFETEEMICKTIDLVGSVQIESPGVNIFYPYRGTRLRDVCEEYGMMENTSKYDIEERRESILNLPHISGERLQYYHDNFEDLVRRKEGILPYVKYKSKETAKKVLPDKMRKMIRKVGNQNHAVGASQSYVID